MENNVAPVAVSRWLVWLIWPVHQIIRLVFFRVEVVGHHRIPASGPVILTPTHRSRWDPVLLPMATRRTLRFMASHDEFVGLQGWFMRRLGAFPVNTTKVGPSVLKASAKILQSGDALVIFPEGTIYYYRPGEVHPIKPGSAWIALDAQTRLGDASVHVIPVRMVYSDRFPRFRTRVRIEVGEPIPVERYLDLPRKQSTPALTEDLRRALGDRVNHSTVERTPTRDSGLPVDRSAILRAQFQAEPNPAPDETVPNA